MTMIRSLTTLFLVINLALPMAPAPHAQEKAPQGEKTEKTECGTVVPPAQVQADLARGAFAALQSPPPIDAPYYLPMTIHIVHRSDGTGGFTPSQLEIAMRDLNQFWRRAGIQFFIYGEIDHINNDTHFIILEDQAAREALRTLNVVANTINVYFTNLGNLGGQASFTTSANQGILMNNIAAGNVYAPALFAHEVGHYFDLYHTHETAFGVECPNGNNCSQAGDRLCDTAADPGLLIPGTSQSRVDDNCAYDNSAAVPMSCDETPYNPPTGNLMSYTNEACRDQLTGNQISRALQTLRDAANRRNLIVARARYVDPLAGASGGNCNYNSPCRTVAKAVEAAQDGDFIFLKPGVHKALSLGGKRVTLNRWGTAGLVEIAP
jgi:Pregnancy-associated plasma protein-A